MILISALLDWVFVAVCPFWGTCPNRGIAFESSILDTSHSDDASGRYEAAARARSAVRRRAGRASASACASSGSPPGLTQTELAGDRFSKEYISQIERGKTRPTSETVDWLALRLGVDSGFLANGVSADDRARAEAILARADALLGEHVFDDAIAEYTRALPAVLGTGSPSSRSAP